MGNKKSKPTSGTTSTSNPSTPSSVKKEREQPKNVILVGESGVGKSSLLLRFYKNEFTTDDDELRVKTTVGTDFVPHKVPVNGREVELHIWDTGGQERYAVMTQSYYRGADCVILVYDASNESSFETIPKWHEEVKRYAKKANVALVLCANKSDLTKSVDPAQAKDVWKNLPDTGGFFETSALNGTNVTEAFTSWIK